MLRFYGLFFIGALTFFSTLSFAVETGSREWLLQTLRPAIHFLKTSHGNNCTAWPISSRFLITAEHCAEAPEMDGYYVTRSGVKVTERLKREYVYDYWGSDDGDIKIVDYAVFSTDHELQSGLKMNTDLSALVPVTYVLGYPIELHETLSLVTCSGVMVGGLGGQYSNLLTAQAEDCPIAPGNSGGPLFRVLPNKKIEVLGIATLLMLGKAAFTPMADILADLRHKRPDLIGKMSN